jgi:hypothetical protein
MKKLLKSTLILLAICSTFLTSAQNKVVILDSIQAKKIITELVRYDGCRAELKIFKQMDSISKSRISTLKASIKYLNLAYEEKEAEALELKKAIDLQSKVIRRERNKTTFYKITSFIGLGAIGYFILK